MVPHIIHYCWFGDKDLPESAKKNIESWKKYMPGFKIVRHDESNFDVSSNRYTREAYEYKKYAFVSDYARLKIIYDNGGIYFDTDVELVRPLSPEMLKSGFFAKEDRRRINTGIGFAAKKGDRTVKKMLREYENVPFILEEGKFNVISCPIKNTRSIKNDIVKRVGMEWVENKIIYPKKYFAPLDYRTGILTLTQETFAIHHCSASWLDKKTLYMMNYKHRCIKDGGRIKGLAIYYLTRGAKIKNYNAT